MLLNYHISSDVRLKILRELAIRFNNLISDAIFPR